jgi:hypothetical protein
MQASFLNKFIILVFASGAIIGCSSNKESSTNGEKKDDVVSLNLECQAAIKKQIGSTDNLKVFMYNVVLIVNDPEMQRLCKGEIQEQQILEAVK